MPPVDTRAFDEEVARALGLLGATPETPASDALVDPRAAADALAEAVKGAGNEVILRVAPELGPAIAGFTPRPADPLWLRIRPGSADVATAPLRSKTDGAGLALGQARRVAVVTSAGPCCDAPSCKLSRTTTSVWIEITGSGSEERGLLAAEARDLEPEKAIERARGIAAAIASTLAVPLFVNGTEIHGSEARAASERFQERDRDDAPRPRLAAKSLARFAIRGEGDRIVVRDHATYGPREKARRTLLVGAFLVVVAGLLWAQMARSLGGESRGAPIAFGALAALISITAYAFLGVGRFASRYVADSTPVAAFGVDKMIVAPWVGRDGSVDLRPEGRLGAAIPIFEVRAASVKIDAERAVVELETDHGPIDSLSSSDRDVAEVFCEAMRGAIDDARHPKVGASARQRARAKAHA